MKNLSLEEFKDYVLEICYGIDLFKRNEKEMLLEMCEHTYDYFIEDGKLKSNIDATNFNIGFNAIAKKYNCRFDYNCYRVPIVRILYMFS